MLVLIGLGLNPKKHLTLQAIDYIKKVDELFMELYTSRIMDISVYELEKFLGKEIKILNRNTVESDFLVNMAKEKNIGLLVPGDPMMATTHIELKLSAKDKNVEFHVVNGISIQCVIPSITGLQNYKFGRSVSLPFPEYDFYPESVYNFIKDNRSLGLHTIVFLDLKDDIEMSANMAMDILLKMEDIYKKDVISEDMLIVVISRAGSEEQMVKAGKIKDLINMNFGKTPHIIVIPGNLHYVESEALEKFADLK